MTADGGDGGDINRGGNIVTTDIEDEMKDSYLDYAMSVIVGRALPDVRDGLKPVHRRIFMGMHDLSLTTQTPYRKSGTVTGDVTGNYPPHGTASVYDTIVRLAQDFSMRYVLVDGQGNFGSIDGDPPAAERYTEVRMSPLSGKNFCVISTRTLLILFPTMTIPAKNRWCCLARFLTFSLTVPRVHRGGYGETNVPPHNLGEVIDALLLFD